MRFDEIYNRVIPYWGDKIEFDDGQDTPPKGKLAQGNWDNYFYSPKMSMLWDKVENEVNADCGETSWFTLMVWTMWQEFHKTARQSFKNGTFQFDPKNVSKESIEKRYFTNLNDEFYEKELKLYVTKSQEYEHQQRN